MSHVLAYDGQFFRVDITEVANPDDPDKAVYFSWCSHAFKELKDMPRQALSRFIASPPLPNNAEARRHAYDWIKTDWDAQKTTRANKVRDIVGVMYTVWLFKGDSSSGFEFEDFSDAKTFAKLAEKSVEITKVGITNNESPQNLTIWERGT
jgi:hypothetical protein